jgi:hypothetical protein
MLSLNAHFDGKAIILDEPFSTQLQPGTRLKVIVETEDDTVAVTPESANLNGPKAGSAKGKVMIAPNFDEPLEEFSEYMK